MTIEIVLVALLWVFVITLLFLAGSQTKQASRSIQDFDDETHNTVCNIAEMASDDTHTIALYTAEIYEELRRQGRRLP